MKQELRKSGKTQFGFGDFKSWHPYQTMLYVFMGGSAIMFLLLLMLYFGKLRSIQTEQFLPSLPKAFIFSTIFLLISSFSLVKAQNAFERDAIKTAFRFLIISAVLGLLFSGLQIAGWIELSKNGQSFTGTNNGAPYLYMISGIHLLHILFAFILLGGRCLRFYKATLHPADELILITNPYEKVKMKMLLSFWHYADGVWLLLFLFFALTLK